MLCEICRINEVEESDEVVCPDCARASECKELFDAGLNLREISEEMEMNIYQIVEYIIKFQGTGDISTNILFSFDEELISHYEDIIQHIWTTVPQIKSIEYASGDYFFPYVERHYKDYKELDKDLFIIYFEQRWPRMWIGDLYYELYNLEKTLHSSVKNILEIEFGTNEMGWWRNIPLKVRNNCNNRREEDSKPVEPYNYTTLIDKLSIIEKNWNLFAENILKNFKSKKNFHDEFVRTNEIRNRVMHPIKYSPSINDLFIVNKFHGKIWKSIGE